mmetsp:Transcript_18619/g.34944  ORF Transcript_18619/g.34944 Transcript_18619/m.34944 type:complete len:556 (-) Transcript_18619:58-1725(-)
MFTKSVIACCLLLTAKAAPGSFRGSPEGRSVSVEEIQLSLQDAMEAVLTSGAASKRASFIEARTWQTFQALPKNHVGRLAPRAVRYLVHSYFMKEHGWLIQGLDPHANQAEVSEVHEVSILQDKAPALVESLLEARRSNHGLSLNDVVAMIAALERLIFDESLALLHASYTFNGFSPAEVLPQAGVHNVLTSYLLLFQLGSKGNLTDARLHQALKARVSQREDWPGIVDFESDTVFNFEYARSHVTNPFIQPQYSFEDVTEMVDELAHGYGQWQNRECQEMKEELIEADVDGDGQIPLSRFYLQNDRAKYQFSESQQYLQEIGALDESGPEPKVRIANYLQGPSNCIASSAYYSICCLSECESLLNELEMKVRAPTADPAHLLGLVSNVSSATVDAPRHLSPVLAQRLRDIAGHNDGQVPLHGRLFAEWLHYAFPNECPYPKLFEEAKTLTPGHWAHKKMSVDVEERLMIASTMADLGNESSDSSDTVEIAWSSEELLHAHETSTRSRGVASMALRSVMQVALLLGVLRAAAASWQTLYKSMGKNQKTDASHLPF